MGLKTSQPKELKYLATCAQLSTLEDLENGTEEHWAETMRRDLIEAKRYLKMDCIKTAFG